MPDSSMVEQVAVNDKVVGSSPTWAAKTIRRLVVYASGQRMWTVNPSSYEFVGSNPTATTYKVR